MSSGSSGSGWNSTSTLAGLGAASTGPARREASDSISSAAEVSGHAGDPDGAGDRPEGVEQGLGPDPADDARRQMDEDRDPHGDQQGQLEVEPGQQRVRRQGDQGGERQAADDGQGLGGPLGLLVVVGDGVGPLGPAMWASQTSSRRLRE